MKQDVRSILDDRRPHRILVVGDLMLDRYVWGEVDRISPEAPIPVLRISREEDRLGGAASVACNLSTLGCRASLAGVIGADAEGERLRALLCSAAIGASAVSVDASRPTVLKCRQLARGQQVLRVDREVSRPLGSSESVALLAGVRTALQGVDALVLSDYGKGVLEEPLLAQLLAAARAAQVPVLVDPKKMNFEVYRGADLITPNRGEAARALGAEIRDVGSAHLAAARLVDRFDFGAVALTLDRDGMVLATRGGGSIHLPTQVREVIDVTGAGDMVISIFALAIAGGHELAAAGALANIAGGLVVSRVGVVSVSRMELRAAVSHEAGQHLRKLVEPEDIAAISAVCRQRGQRVVLAQWHYDGLVAADIDRLRLAKEAGEVVVIALEAGERTEHTPEPARILAALEDVDYIVLRGAQTDASLLAGIVPDVLVVPEGRARAGGLATCAEKAGIRVLRAP